MRSRSEVKQRLLEAFGARVGSSIFDVLEVADLYHAPLPSCQDMVIGKHSSSGKSMVTGLAKRQSLEIGQHSALGGDFSSLLALNQDMDFGQHSSLGEDLSIDSPPS